MASYREHLKVTNPSLEAVKQHPEANTFALLIVALIERDGPMTLADVAERFEAAGVAPADEALDSLKRCRPARAPVYREGDLYCLDPHDAMADLWTFRLGLRPPKVARIKAVRPEPPPLSGPDVRLTPAELDKAWKDAALQSSLSARKIVLAVLDAHGGPMTPEDVIAAVAARTRWHGVRADPAKFKQHGSPIAVDAEGRWAVAPGSGEALMAARSAVRERLAAHQRYEHARPDPEEIAANRRAHDAGREAHRAEQAKLRRVIVYGFPSAKAEALALIDVAAHTIDTFLGDEIASAQARLSNYDVIAGLDVRALLRGIGVDPADLRLAELGPPQKSKKLNKSGRTLKITAELLVRGSCGISRPFDPDGLRKHLAAKDTIKLRRRLEADAKALHAFYQYGRVHGAVRLRWGFLDENIPAPWVSFHEETLRGLMSRAHAHDLPLEVVVGGAPGWDDPWSRAFSAYVVEGRAAWDLYLVDEHGFAVPEADVQLARLAAPIDEARMLH